MNEKTLDVVCLGRRKYDEVWEKQKELVDQRRFEAVPDTLILVEHDPVYTLGKNSNEDHLLQSRDK
ncbi:MAG: lipoyl(octanoyl) transferase, partial [Dehalococcoidia bacterium]|nr:lipoyl(octanoyl) transferase [Dehalococcoidia bacterium]